MTKLIRFAILLLGMALLLASCQKAPIFVMNDPHSYSFTSEGGSQSFSFTCNRNWRVSTSESWITVSRSSGEASDGEITLKIICSENTSYGPRKANVIIKQEDGPLSETIEITQEADEILLKERAALVVFYESTNGDKWLRNDNWCSDKPLSEWYGLTVRSIGGANRVTKLELGENNLIGSIPESFGDLEYLEYLALNNNSLHGKLPESIGSLQRLSYLLLQHNQLSGHLPSSFGSLTSLVYLVLSDNWFSGPLPDISRMYNLQYFNIATYSIGPEGGEIDLGEVRERYNHFTGQIPESIGELRNLETFTILCNQISGSIPESIWSLPRLRSLLLSGNPISGTLSPAISKATSLVQLWLNNCELTGTLPKEICELHSLRELILGNSNAFAGIGECDYWNHFDGELPEDIGSMENLKQFDFFRNNITGSLPESMARLDPEISVSARENRMSGEVPLSVVNHPNFNFWLLEPQQDGFGLTWDSSSEASNSNNQMSVNRTQESVMQKAPPYANYSSTTSTESSRIIVYYGRDASGRDTAYFKWQ